jgi:Tol biopolymer transport system component
MKVICRLFLWFLFWLLASQGTIHAQNQPSQTFFGKNKIQYRPFEWSVLSGPNFEVLYSVGGRELGVYTATIAEETIRKIEEFLNYRADGKYQIIIYNNIADLNQTNLGFDLEQYNTGGLTRLSGNKVLVHFSESRDDFLRELRVGIAKVLLFDMMYGGNIGERVQNAALIFLPDWYINGLFAYLHTEWGAKQDNALRDLLSQKRIRKFNHLLQNHTDLAGHSFWHYISETYGKTAVPNMLYLTRINRDFQAGLRYVTGKKMKALSKDWLTFYKDRYDGDDALRSLPSDTLYLRKFRKAAELTELKFSPDGTKMAYVEHKKGIHRMYVHEIGSKKRTLVHKSGVKWLYLHGGNQYPVLSWHPSGRSLAYFFDIKGRVHFGTVRLNDKEKNEVTEYPLFRIDQVYNIDYSPDGQHLALSGARNGQTDIYLYHIPSKRLIPITQDAFDDYEPRYFDGGKKLLFASNRPTDSLYVNAADAAEPMATTDVFVYFNEDNKRERLLRVTSTPSVNERQPQWQYGRFFSFLSDANGIFNRQLAELDSIPYEVYSDSTIFLISEESDTTFFTITDTSIAYHDTAYYVNASNYRRNIRWHDTRHLSGHYIELLEMKSKRPMIYYGRLRPVALEEDAQLADRTDYRKLFDRKVNKKPAQTRQLPGITTPIGMLDNSKYHARYDSLKSRYTFQSQLRFPLLEEELVPGEAPVVRDIESFRKRIESGSKDPYRVAKTRLYTSTMSTDYLVSQVGNTIFQNDMPSFTVSTINALNQNVGLILKGGLSDLFEDHKLSGGMLINADFSNNQYYLMYEYLRKRWDQRYLFVQSRSQRNEGFAAIKTNTLEGMAQFSYPFNRYQSVRLSAIYRSDFDTYLSTDLNRLIQPGELRHVVGAKTEFVQDNTKELALNTLRGTRWKAFVEGYKFLDAPNDYMTIVGVDYRTYLQLYKNLIWANRLASSVSLGSRKTLFMMGGVDNWLLPRIDNSLAPPANENFAYRAFGTNMRGFLQNSRNGANFFLVNSEIRFPFVQVLSRSPVSSEFWRNLAIVGFADVGTAWSGIDPFSLDNPFNVTEFRDGPVSVTVVTNKNPVIAGYGLGARMHLFGYFLRIDRAWGLDDGQILRPVWYFSLSLDF